MKAGIFLPDTRPNILFIMSDDHAAHAISCYGSKINQTPNLDRIANEGMVLDNCFCTNSICAPSRAVILTGKHSHLNGVMTLADTFDGNQQTYQKLLQKAGYQTAIVGKWHLANRHNHKEEVKALADNAKGTPIGFDYFNVLTGQGPYFNPAMVENGVEQNYTGYTTDIITDLSIKWLDNRDKSKPFCMMCHHKAPHRKWEPDNKHADMYENENIPEPETLFDDYSNRAKAAEAALMRVAGDMNYGDLKLIPPEGIKQGDKIIIPDDLSDFRLHPVEGEGPVEFGSRNELVRWMYQRYIKDYLRCIASIDDNVGRLLDYLDHEELAENTIVIYTSDQGFFLGDHGWYDKRFMYEESLRMPFMIRYPKEIKAGTRCDAMALNLDFASTFLDYAEVTIPDDIQGRSLRSLLAGNVQADWRTAMYYRYWMHLAHHNVYAHYGIRTHRYKLIYYYSEALGTSGSTDISYEPEWELFDLKMDPMELKNVYNDPKYKDLICELKAELIKLQKEAGDK